MIKWKHDDKEEIYKFISAMSLFSPSLRESFLKNDDFLAEWDIIEAQHRVRLGERLEIDQKVFFDSVKNALTHEREVPITDDSGNDWTLTYCEGTDGDLKVESNHDDTKFIAQGFYYLAAKKESRLRGFNKVVAAHYMPGRIRGKWSNCLKKEALSPSQIPVFDTDVEMTVQSTSDAIVESLRNSRNDSGDLVPSKAEYYERVIGTYRKHSNINEFINTVLTKNIDQLLAWNQIKGLKYALSTCAHPSIAPTIDIKSHHQDDLLKLYSWALKHGDPMSQTAAIELAFSNFENFPFLEGITAQLISSVCNDKLEKKEKGIHLYSSVVVVVYSELSRQSLFTDTSPYYRKLAAFFHASVLYRILVASKIDYHKFNDWAHDVFFINYVGQAFCDMKSEPRWRPSQIHPSQVKADMVGRIAIAAERNKQSLEKSNLCELIWGDGEDSVKNNVHYLDSYQCGPLEGGEEAKTPIPEVLTTAINDKIASSEPGIGRFIVLLNLVRVFTMEQRYADKVSEYVKDARYHLEKLESRTQLVNALSRIATLAAVSRSEKLADETLILLKVNWRNEEHALNADEYFIIGLEAAASRENKTDWCEFIGLLLSQFAFSNLTNEEAQIGLMYFDALVRCEPELWRTCAKAYAALKTVEKLIIQTGP